MKFVLRRLICISIAFWTVGSTTLSVQAAETRTCERASQESQPSEDRVQPRGSISCEATTSHAIPGTTGSPGDPVRSGPAPPTYSYEVPVTQEDGTRCTVSRTRELPEALGDSLLPPEAAGAIVEDTANILADFAPCPEALRSATPSSPPRVIAARYWEEIPLPAPDPYIAPGRAITGLASFLETRGTLSFDYENPTTIAGPLTIAASGRYEVDWGDGIGSGPYAVEGGPWPDGSIVHTYTDVGTYDVVVRIAWTATWNLGGASGTLYELRTESTIEDFPVGQLQAVVVG